MSEENAKRMDGPTDLAALQLVIDWMLQETW